MATPLLTSLHSHSASLVGAPAGAGLAAGASHSARLAVGGVQAHHAGVAQVGLGPGLVALGQRGARGVTQQAVEGVVAAGIAQARLGAQHEHGQALERGRQQVACADQQHLGIAALEGDAAGEHAALGRQQGGQPCVLLVQQGKVLGQLAVEEFGGVFTGYADHAKMVQGGHAVPGQGGRRWLLVVHALNYDARLSLLRAAGLCVVFSFCWCSLP